MSVELDGTRFGPLPVSKLGSTSFGPMDSPLAGHAVARWTTENGENQEQTIYLREKAPLNFSALRFFVEVNGQLTVSFVVRIGGWRDLDIPVSESPQPARLRELNESLYVAAGRGKFLQSRTLLRRARTSTALPVPSIRRLFATQLMASTRKWSSTCCVRGRE